MIHTLDFSHLVAYDGDLSGTSLNIKISVVGGSAEFTAKVDTGATDCIFACQYGEQIGLDIEAGRLIEISTAIGTFKTFQHWVMLSVLDYEFDVAMCFAADEHFSRNVLGRIGFLNQVLLGLNDYEGKFYLSSLAELWQ